MKSLNIVIELAEKGDLQSLIKEKQKNNEVFEEELIWKCLSECL